MVYIGLPAAQSDPPRLRNQVCCRGCREWYKGWEHAECPKCGRAPSGRNSHIRTAILDNHLLGQAAAADANR